MKKILLGLLFIIGVSGIVFAQGFQEHTVVAGETLELLLKSIKFHLMNYIN